MDDCHFIREDTLPFGKLIAESSRYLFLFGLGPRDGLGKSLPAQELRVPLLDRFGEELVVEAGVAEVDRPRGRVHCRVHFG